MKEPRSLVDFKKSAQRFHCAYHLASIGLERLGDAELSEIRSRSVEDYTLRDNESGEIISAIPVRFLRQGIKKDGPISQTIALSFLSWIYAGWEHKYRKLIAAELGVKPGCLQSDVMGDLRLIRHYAAHDIDRPEFNSAKLKSLTWLRSGLLIIKSSDMDKIHSRINSMRVTISKSESEPR